ncbi:hypothetical protein BLA29_013492, partial [Euroglyphus maynei]
MIIDLFLFFWQGLAQATQPSPTDTSMYKGAYQSADLFTTMHHASGYHSGHHHHHPHHHHHHGSTKAHLNFAAMHGTPISPSSSGTIFPSATSYWSSTGAAAANLYSNIAAASNHAAAASAAAISHHHTS